MRFARLSPSAALRLRRSCTTAPCSAEQQDAQAAAQAAGLERLTVAIGISEAGVDFNALDKQPVHSIFLLISPEERPEEHIDAMEAIFGNLSKDQFRRFLRQAGDVEEIITLLEEADAGQSVG